MPRISFERWPRDRRWPRGTVLLAVCFIAAAPMIAAWAHFDTARERLQRRGFILGEGDATKLHALLLQSGSMEVANRGLLPSTLALPRPAIEDGQPTISISAAERHLTSPRDGIITHPLKKGRQWERPATMSYFEGGQLKHETAIGLRVHGGKSRKGPTKSFQMVFRRSYAGSPRSTAGIFFNGESQPYARLILANTTKPQRFLNPLALEIAERAGCMTSRSQPVRVYLRGEPMPCGYFLLEHQSREFLQNHLGHDEFEWIRLKGTHRPSPPFDALLSWVKRAPAPLTMEAVRQQFNLDDLCAWILAISLCGTTDNDQGGYFLDQKDPDARWRCVAWDMDGSFNHGNPVHDLTVLFEQVKGVRARLFNRLSAEDPAFRAYFHGFVRDFFEHRFSREERRALVARYRGMAVSPIFTESEKHLRLLDTVEHFLEARIERYLSDYDRFVADGPIYDRHRKRR